MTVPRCSRSDRGFAAIVLFAVEVCNALACMSMGLLPQAVVGYSLGEVAASVVSGRISVLEGLQLSVRIAVSPMKATLHVVAWLLQVWGPKILFAFMCGTGWVTCRWNCGCQFSPLLLTRGNRCCTNAAAVFTGRP